MMKDAKEKAERLTQETLKTMDSIKADYETKLFTINQNYMTVKSENITLKERNDILFKLSKTYLDKYEKPDGPSSSKSAPVNRSPAITGAAASVIPTHDTPQGNIPLPVVDVVATRPSNPPNTIVSPIGDISPEVQPTNIPSNNHGPQATREVHNDPRLNYTNNVQNNIPNSTTSTQSNTRYKRYCHYYVNYGRCNFEERTRRKCQYLHEAAPLCRNGMNCRRDKCMYTHPKPQSHQNFLSSQSSFINPWQYPPQMIPQLFPWSHTQAPPQQQLHQPQQQNHC